MQIIIQRFKEPSTHAGIALLLHTASMFFPEYKVFFHGASMAFAVNAVIAPECGPAKSDQAKE
jgi:hypothetical protein